MCFLAVTVVAGLLPSGSWNLVSNNWVDRRMCSTLYDMLYRRVLGDLLVSSLFFLVRILSRCNTSKRAHRRLADPLRKRGTAYSTMLCNCEGRRLFSGALTWGCSWRTPITRYE